MHLRLSEVLFGSAQRQSRLVHVAWSAWHLKSHVSQNTAPLLPLGMKCLSCIYSMLSGGFSSQNMTAAISVLLLFTYSRCSCFGGTFLISDLVVFDQHSPQSNRKARTYYLGT